MTSTPTPSSGGSESGSTSAAAPPTPTPLLEAVGIGKRFPGVRALEGVGLSVGRGEVVALIGENGAGKSTLMRILAGIERPDEGELRLDGRPVVWTSPRNALDRGIALIHQELNLCGNLDVESNIFLGREPRRAPLGLIDRSAIRTRTRALLDMVGARIPPRAKIDDLSIGQCQLVEIAKALSTNARLLIMDEPTSSLSTGEAENLFRVVRDLRARGVSVIYISHRLGEVRELADRVVVLRDGRNSGTIENRADITHDRMVRMMVGRDVSQFYARRENPIGRVALRARGLVTRARPGHALSFEVREGEIVGVAGLVGAGRTEMLRALFGIDPPLSGVVEVRGRRLIPTSPARAIAAGLALVPEDRKLEGLILEMSVRHNVGLAALRANARAGFLLNAARERDDARDIIRRLGVKTPHDRQIVRNLSGGNQQKIVLAKWLALRPAALLLDEPTRGVDIGAKAEIYALMEDLAAEGLAVLFVSSEMEEILGMADRVLVMHEGRIAGELSRAQLTEEAVMNLATGGDRRNDDEPGPQPRPPAAPAA